MFIQAICGCVKKVGPLLLSFRLHTLDFIWQLMKPIQVHPHFLCSVILQWVGRTNASLFLRCELNRTSVRNALASMIKQWRQESIIISETFRTTVSLHIWPIIVHALIIVLLQEIFLWEDGNVRFL